VDSATFEIEIIALHSYFQRKKPDKSMIGLWFENVKHVPAGAADWIRQWICKEFDGLPRNIGKAFNAGWYQWQATNNNAGTKDKVVLDGITGRLKWHDDPDGTEYISIKEFRRRSPEYADKLDNLKGIFKKVIYDDTIPF